MVKNEDTKVEKQNLKSECKKQKLSNVETDRQTNKHTKQTEGQSVLWTDSSLKIKNWSRLLIRAGWVH